MKLKLEFNMDNAAFDPDNGGMIEAQIILENVGQRVRNDETAGIIRDSNGNTIGKWAITGNRG